MQERSDDIGATLEISSAPADGTKVVLVVPTDNNPALQSELDEDEKDPATE
jgi:nitrate/nitrite-specific signal transduction histidine kinase